MTASKSTRWLDLLAYLLQHHFPVTREQIFEHVSEYAADRASGANAESLRRKFERDKDELRGLGIDIETVSLGVAHAGDEPGQGYRLRARDFYLPYLELDQHAGAGEHPYPGLHRVRLSQEELALLDRASRRVADARVPVLSEAARSARRKLEFDLPLPLASVERVLSRALGEEDARTLGVLQRALVERTAVRCRYYAIGRDREEERVLEPWGLFFSWGRWYCVAFSRERAAQRVFRMDRMRGAEPLRGGDARFEVPAGFSVRTFLGRAPWELSDRPAVPARVRFWFPESRWVQAQGAGEAVEPLLEDGGAILAFSVHDANPFLRWLLTFRRVEVLEPAGLAAEFDTLRRRIADLYRGGAA